MAAQRVNKLFSPIVHTLGCVNMQLTATCNTTGGTNAANRYRHTRLVSYSPITTSLLRRHCYCSDGNEVWRLVSTCSFYIFTEIKTFAQRWLNSVVEKNISRSATQTVTYGTCGFTNRNFKLLRHLASTVTGPFSFYILIKRFTLQLTLLSLVNFSINVCVLCEMLLKTVKKSVMM